MAKFEKPYSQVRDGERFNLRELGLNHPDNKSFIKIADNGDVEISAGPGISIILHPHNRSITFVADSIKMLVRDHDGVKINDLILNTDATNYSEPTFLESDPVDMSYFYDGTVEFVQNLDNRKVVDPNTQSRIQWDEYVKLYKREPTWNGSYFE